MKHHPGEKMNIESMVDWIRFPYKKIPDNIFERIIFLACFDICSYSESRKALQINELIDN